MAGETTSLAGSANKLFYDQAGAGAFVQVMSQSFSTTQNELNDVMEMGYIAPNTRVVAVLYAPTDMDTNVSPALVQKITVNAVDMVTALTGGQSGTASWQVPTTTFATTTPGSSPQLVTITSTTAAATAAAGTVTLVFLCQHI
jgi:hypothetical protein